MVEIIIACNCSTVYSQQQCRVGYSFGNWRKGWETSHLSSSCETKVKDELCVRWSRISSLTVCPAREHSRHFIYLIYFKYTLAWSWFNPSLILLAYFINQFIYMFIACTYGIEAQTKHAFIHVDLFWQIDRPWWGIVHCTQPPPFLPHLDGVVVPLVPPSCTWRGQCPNPIDGKETAYIYLPCNTEIPHSSGAKWDTRLPPSSCGLWATQFCCSSPWREQQRSCHEQHLLILHWINLDMHL